MLSYRLEGFPDQLPSGVPMMTHCIINGQAFRKSMNSR
jgi:hypothetical protein